MDPAKQVDSNIRCALPINVALASRFAHPLPDAARVIQAARSVSGLSGRDARRGMLARLQPKEEVLLLGWGVPMPLPARGGSRRYDDAFWKELLGGGKKKSEAENLKELGF